MKIFLKFIFILSLFFIISCASDDSELDTLAKSLIIESSNIYSIDDLKKAGWKQDRQFDNSEYPETIDIAFGFFQKKDIEAWVYISHEDAKKFGVKYGDQSIEKKAGQTDYLIPRVNRFHAYVIIGNLMLLCETEILDCQKLIDNFD
jgi:transcription termination factor Rho